VRAQLVPGPLLSTAVAALVAPSPEIGDGAAVALVHGPGLVGDLAGATHVLRCRRAGRADRSDASRSGST
jgi:hypothetical protein